MRMKIAALSVGLSIQLALLGFNILITIYMEIEQRGVFALITAIIMIVSGLSSFGFCNALIRRISISEISKDYMKSLSWIIVAQSILASLVTLVLIGLYETLQMDSIEVIQSVALVIVILLKTYIQSILIGLNLIKYFQISKVLSIYGLLILVLANGDYTINGIVYSWLTTEITVVIIFGIVLKNKFKMIRYINENKIKDDTYFGIKSIFGQNAFIEGYKIDVLLLGSILSFNQLAIYALAKVIVSTLRFVPQSLSQIAYPDILRKPEDEKNKCTNGYVVLASALTIVMGIVVYLIFSSGLVSLLDPKYMEVNEIIGILLISMLLYVPRRIVYEYFKAINAPQLTSKIEFLIFSLYMILILFFLYFSSITLEIAALVVVVINAYGLIIVYHNKIRFSKWGI